MMATAKKESKPAVASAEVKKAPAKKAAAKKTAPKKELKTRMEVQYNGQSTCNNCLTKKAKEIWQKNGKKVSDMESLEMYVKPEENAVYFVINGEELGCYPLFD